MNSSTAERPGSGVAVTVTLSAGCGAGAGCAAADVAATIAYLADGEKSGFVNGVSLPVDGGWIADASWESLRLSTRTP